MSFCVWHDVEIEFEDALPENKCRELVFIIKRASITDASRGSDAHDFKDEDGRNFYFKISGNNRTDWDSTHKNILKEIKLAGFAPHNYHSSEWVEGKGFYWDKTFG